MTDQKLDNLKIGDCIADNICTYEVVRHNSNGSVTIVGGNVSDGTRVGMSYTPEELEEAGFKKGSN